MASANNFVGQIQGSIVCPECHQPLTVENNLIRCSSCDFTGSMRDGVVLLIEDTSTSFFDDKSQVMDHFHADDGEWNFAYAEQTRVLEKHLKPGMLVVDAGCGPSLPYNRNGAFVVGLDMSFPSIRSNSDVDMRVLGSATRMPFSDQTVDAVVCFYSLHHFVGDTVVEARKIMTGAFREFARVIKPGGFLFVFEMIALAPAAVAQNLAWNSARKVLGKRLDMHFWTSRFFDQLRLEFMPDAVLERIVFPCSLTASILPLLSLPRLKVYRFLYPLTPRLFKFVF